MFKAKQASGMTYVPSKLMSIKPEAQVNYEPDSQTQVRFLIPQYLGFIDPRGVVLKYDIQMRGRGYARPDPRGGVQSLWRNYRLQDGSAQTTLEECDDYDALVASWWQYDRNDSIEAIRTMFQGVSPQGGGGVDSQLYYGTPGDWTGGDVTANRTAKTLQIEQPIYSGLIGPQADKIFPVGATSGLRLQMNLDSKLRSLQTSTNLGLETDKTAAEQWLFSKTDKATTDDSKAAIDSVFTMAVKGLADATAVRIVNRDASPEDNNPLCVGDMLYIALADGTVPQSLGIITKFAKDGDGDLVVTYIPDRAITTDLGTAYPADSRVFYKQTDRLSTFTTANVPADSLVDNVPISYVISDLEMVVPTVNPPPAYAAAMLKQIQSSKGMTMTYKTQTLYRVNLNSTNGVSNQFVPADQTMAYSILSLPLDTAQERDIEVSSFRGAVDGQQNYQFSFDGELVPNRPVDIFRATQTPAKNDALAAIEIEKALGNCGYAVRDLHGIPDKFIIGRAWSRYGNVFDLQAGSLGLRVEYTAATTQKAFDHWICHLRSMNISPSGVRVSV